MDLQQQQDYHSFLVLQVVRSGLLEVVYLQVAVPERPGHIATGIYEDSLEIYSSSRIITACGFYR